MQTDNKESDRYKMGLCNTELNIRLKSEHKSNTMW